MLEGLKDCLMGNLKDLLPLELFKELEGKLAEFADKAQALANEKANEAEEALNDKLKANTEPAENAQMKKLEAVANQGYNVQEAKKSVKFTEQLMSETKYTKPKDLQNADYTTNINYPDRYGHIDTNKNWFAVDKKKKYIEAVHSSGSLFHIDQEGNVSIHITGSLKLIVDKDIAIEGRASMDRIIKGSDYTHISGKKSLLVDGDIDNTTMASLTDTVSIERTLSTGSNFNNSVGANYSNNVSASCSNTAGASYTITALSIGQSASGSATSSAGGGMTTTANTKQIGDYTISGNVNVSGSVGVGGSVNAGGDIIAAGSSDNHHSH